MSNANLSTIIQIMNGAAGLEPRWVWPSAVAVSEEHGVVRTLA